MWYECIYATDTHTHIHSEYIAQLLNCRDQNRLKVNLCMSLLTATPPSTENKEPDWWSQCYCGVFVFQSKSNMVSVCMFVARHQHLLWPYTYSLLCVHSQHLTYIGMFVHTYIRIHNKQETYERTNELLVVL